MIEIDVLHRHGIGYILFSYGNKYCLTKHLLGVKISEQVSLSESNDTLLHTPAPGQEEKFNQNCFCKQFVRSCFVPQAACLNVLHCTVAYRLC